MDVPAPRVFLSHSSLDDGIVKTIAEELGRRRIEVWYDDWEIKVGDSIVERVFDGLGASDTLIVVLSPNSVRSRWVREELNTMMMRKLSEHGIRILPVLISDCEVPLPLLQLRYADFRRDFAKGISDVLDSLLPLHRIWQALSDQFKEFNEACARILNSVASENIASDLFGLHTNLQTAVNLRTELEARKAGLSLKTRDLFDQIDLLAGRGLDVRDATWNRLVKFRSTWSHETQTPYTSLRAAFGLLAGMAPENSEKEHNLRRIANSNLESLRKLMEKLCFESHASLIDSRDTTP